MAAVSSPASRRVAALALAFVMIVAVSAAAWLLRHATAPVRLSAQAPLPPLSFQTPGGIRALRAVPGRRTVVMLFRPGCSHCRRELDHMNAATARLRDTTIVLLTQEASFDPDRDIAAWPALANLVNVTWGTVRADEWSHAFHTSIFPSTFVFDAEARLLHSYRGETGVEQLLGH
jgi:hypothetical protein